MVDANLLNWSLAQLLSVVVILMRVGPVIFLMPIMGSIGVPVQVKALASFAVAALLSTVVDVKTAALPQTAVGLFILVVREMAFALVLSLFMRLIFAATQLAGQYVSVSMGMGVSGTIDPQFGSQESLVGIFWNITAILIFLAMDGHHIFLRALVESFQWVPPGGMQLGRATFNGIMHGVTQMFVLGIKIMAPAGVALIFSHVAMGILAKTVPQIPIMIVSMPLNIAIGFVFVGLSLRFFLPVMVKGFDSWGRELMALTVGMGGR